MTPKTCLIPPCHTNYQNSQRKRNSKTPQTLSDTKKMPIHHPDTNRHNVSCLQPQQTPLQHPTHPPPPFQKEMKMEQSSRFIEANKGSAEYIMAIHFKPRVHLDNQCKRFAQLNKPILPHISTTNKTIRFMFFYSNLASSNIKYGLLSIYV